MIAIECIDLSACLLLVIQEGCFCEKSMPNIIIYLGLVKPVMHSLSLNALAFYFIASCLYQI